jgi:hypothetical protein
VVCAYRQHFPEHSLPEAVYVSHNHTDHAGELPVVLAVERAKGRKLRLCAQHDVLARLTAHRLHELQSTGRGVDYFCTTVSLEAAQPAVVVELARGSSLRMCPLLSRHAELCYGGVLLLDEDPLLGWTVSSPQRAPQSNLILFWHSLITGEAAVLTQCPEKRRARGIEPAYVPAPSGGLRLGPAALPAALCSTNAAARCQEVEQHRACKLCRGRSSRWVRACA